MNQRLIPKNDDYELIGRPRIDAALALANSDPLLLTRGLVDGAKVVHKFGAADAVGGTLVPISSSKTYQMPMTAQALEILSDDVNDNGTTSPLGSGALTVEVIGIADWNAGEVTELVTLDGTSVVALSTLFLRVYRIKVITSGTYATDSIGSHDSTIN